MTSTATITVITTEGARDVEAQVFGGWAVHRAVNAEGWSSTHVATGMCVPPFYTEDLSHATTIRCAKALSQRFPDANPVDPEVGKQMAELILKVALGVVRP